MSDELVRNIDGAVKYVEYLWKSDRGYKILIDEIVFAYFPNRKTRKTEKA